MRRSGTDTSRIRCGLIVESDPVSGFRVLPAHQLHHQLDLLLVAYRRHAEHILDVDDAYPAHLHVVLDQLGRPAHENVVRRAAHLDQIVRHQSVPAHDQFQRRFGLAHAALAHEQDADAEDIHEHAVDARRGRQLALDEGLNRLDRGRGTQRCAQQRHTQAVGGVEQLNRNIEPLGDDDAGGLDGHEGLYAVSRLLGWQAGQVGQLGGAQDLNPLRLHLAHEARQREPRFLHAVDGDATAQPRLTRQQN